MKVPDICSLICDLGIILYAEFPRIGCKQEGSQIGNNKQNCRMRLLKTFYASVENEPKFCRGLLFVCVVF